MQLHLLPLTVILKNTGGSGTGIATLGVEYHDAMYPVQGEVTHHMSCEVAIPRTQGGDVVQVDCVAYVPRGQPFVAVTHPVASTSVAVR
jgi:hypothetical protein